MHQITHTVMRVLAMGVVASAGAAPILAEDAADAVLQEVIVTATKRNENHAHWLEIRRQAHDDQMWDLLANLAYGVTSGLDPQTFTTDVFAYEDMIDAGIMPGPRAWSTGPGVFNNSEILSQTAATEVLTRYRDNYRTRNIKSYMVGDRERRQYMVEAAKTLGMMPTTEGASDLDLDLTHAIDGFSGNEHALPVTPLHEDVIRLFAEGRTSLVPTLSVLYGGEPALFDFIIERRPQQDPKFSHFVPPGIVSEKIRNRRWMPCSCKPIRSSLLMLYASSVGEA